MNRLKCVKDLNIYSVWEFEWNQRLILLRYHNLVLSCHAGSVSGQPASVCGFIIAAQTQ